MRRFSNPREIPAAAGRCSSTTSHDLGEPAPGFRPPPWCTATLWKLGHEQLLVKRYKDRRPRDTQV